MFPPTNATTATPEATVMTLRCTLLGVGAMNSPRYRPAGLLLSYAGRRVVLDGGEEATPGRGSLDAWLVTDERAELVPRLRPLARSYGLTPHAGPYRRGRLHLTLMAVAHTSHPTYGYLIEAGDRRVVWAPEFWEFPDWAAGADLMFADAAGWRNPIRFAGGVGGHASVHTTAREAHRLGVRRLVFAHIGRPSIRARDAGQQPPYGEWGTDGDHYSLPLTRGAAAPGG